MSEYTKGEWLYRKDKEAKHFDDYVINVSGHQPLIARVFSSIDNARLIAAVPDLLDACEITKKRLLTCGNWDDGCFYYGGRAAPELEEPLMLLKAAIAKAQSSTSVTP